MCCIAPRARSTIALTYTGDTSKRFLRITSGTFEFFERSSESLSIKTRTDHSSVQPEPVASVKLRIETL